jgi:hypothetical protein
MVNSVRRSPRPLQSKRRVAVNAHLMDYVGAQRLAEQRTVAHHDCFYSTHCILESLTGNDVVVAVVVVAAGESHCLLESFTGSDVVVAVVVGAVGESSHKRRSIQRANRQEQQVAFDSGIRSCRGVSLSDDVLNNAKERFEIEAIKIIWIFACFSSLQ